MWITANQISIIMLVANIGSDAIYFYNRHTTMEAPMIITQLLIAINVIATMMSLNPLVFLYMKFGEPAARLSHTTTTTRTSKAIVLLSCVFLVRIKKQIKNEITVSY